MSTTTKKKAAQGVRYTDAQKKEVVDFALSYNSTNGRGGQSKAAEKFKISPITIASWLKAGGASAPKKTGTVTKAPVKTAQAPKAAKAAEAPKAVEAPKATKAAKAPKKAGKSKAGTRYTPEEKKQVVDYVASYNATNGRGGQSKAAAKFKVSPLTVMAWLKASGGKPTVKKAAKKGARKAAQAKAAKVEASGGFDSKLRSLLALRQEIGKAEAALAQLNAKFRTLKASL